jgi:hypothetical protein
VAKEEKSMTEFQWETDLTEWFIEGFFIGALLFTVIYVPFFKWRATSTGRAIATLVLAIVGALLHSVLNIWGVTQIGKPGGQGQMNEALAWFAIFSLGAGALAVITLSFTAARFLFAESDNKFVCKALHLGKKFREEYQDVRATGAQRKLREPGEHRKTK